MMFSMLIFDAHLDLAWNAIDWNRDLLLPVSAIRENERDMPEKSRGKNTVSFPELRRGKIAVCIATLLARHLPFHRFTSMPAAYAAAQGQIAYYRALKQQGVIRLIKDWATLNAHVKAWHSDEDNSTEPLGVILSMEGADPVLAPEQIDEWWQAGLRIIGLAHYGISTYAHGTGTEGGLMPQGPALLKAMQRVGMILDVTHLSDQCFDEALDIFGGSILASHHNCRALVPGQRQLTDEQIKRLVGRGSVIGTALDNWMLYPGWVRGESSPELVSFASAIDHIDRVCQLAGNAKHAALGTDLDGGFGKEQSPHDLDTIADLQMLPDLLRRRGYDKQAVADIMFGNWLRFFREAWTRTVA
jgi:membrane dipeptidase